MAREKQITRTVETTTAKVMCLNVSTATATTETFTLGGTYKDNNDILKEVKRLFETDDLKPAAVVETEVNTILYGMPESLFIKYATILPPRKDYTADNE